MIHIKNEEIGYLGQALDAGIRERQEASKRDNDIIMTEADNIVIEVYRNILKRIEKYNKRIGG